MTENIERREKATQVEPAFVYEDTTSGRILIDVQEELSMPRVGDQVKFNVVNSLKVPDHFQSCQIIADTNEKTRPVNAMLKDEILKDSEDGEEDEIKLLSDRIIEQSNMSNDKHLKSAFYSLKLREFILDFTRLLVIFRLKRGKLEEKTKIITEQEYGEKELKNSKANFGIVPRHQDGAATALKHKRIVLDA